MESLSAYDLAYKFINQTHKNVFLTGKAGTGKTTFLNKITKETHKKTIIIAPTGIAAINAGGVTIHSLFQLPFGSFIPNESFINTENNFKLFTKKDLFKNFRIHAKKRALINSLELLVIDEVSMLRADLLDAIDCVLRTLRKKQHLPFGGVQVLFIGDLLQLPPVVNESEWNVLKNYYNSAFFFDAKVLQGNLPIYIELDKIYRQKDEKFINLLNNFRTNKVSIEDIKLLNSHHFPEATNIPKPGYIILTTHNHKANSINQKKLDENSNKSFYFNASIKGEFPENNYPIEKELKLKVGAQVMFIKNDPKGLKRFFNGKIGEIIELSENKIVVQFEDKTTVNVEEYTWENIRYDKDDVSNEIKEKVVGEFKAFPLKLAWAITVHKSQGLTFEKAILDLEDAFAAGQIYVALSRLTSLNGLILSTPINYKSIQLITEIEDFSKQKLPLNQLQTIAITEEKLYLLNSLMQSFNFEDLVLNFKEHTLSYNKKENLSIKQKFQNWSMEIYKESNTLLEFSQKFQKQIFNLFYNTENINYHIILERLKAADNYFNPILQKLSLTIKNHVNEIKNLQKIKEYLDELKELELSVFEAIKNLKKALVLCEKTSKNEVATRNDILEKVNLLERTNEYIYGINKNQKVKSEESETKEQSFFLFQKGKKIQEIALIRNLQPSTIESHLLDYVKNKKIHIEKLVSKYKIENIIRVKTELNTQKSSEIKAVLGDEYSYADIRFTIAYYF
jgi:nucleoside-triphosphatase THEP1